MTERTSQKQYKLVIPPGTEIHAIYFAGLLGIPKEQWDPEGNPAHLALAWSELMSWRDTLAFYVLTRGGPF